MSKQALEGQLPPSIRVAPPGPRSQAWLERGRMTTAPMGPPWGRYEGIVYESAKGANVVDVDGNRYVDLAAGFGAMLLGHGHPAVLSAVHEQAERLLLALGDVFPSSVRLELEEQLLEVMGWQDGRVILGQSGADAVTSALKTACLATGRPGILAWQGAYHGLSYAPLAACGLRAGYRLPFSEQLNQHVRFLPYPTSAEDGEVLLERAHEHLRARGIGAVLIEPILGRGGCLVPPPGFLTSLGQLAREYGAVIVADEIWTGLGRSGSWLASRSQGLEADLICLGKGLGGGLPLSACLGRVDLMQAWQRDPEVVHTTTFTGTPLACAAALALLRLLRNEGWVEHAASQGALWQAEIAQGCQSIVAEVDVRGRGFMIGVEFGKAGIVVTELLTKLRRRGYLATSGGGSRDVMVLTPPLNLDEDLRADFVASLCDVLREQK